VILRPGGMLTALLTALLFVGHWKIAGAQTSIPEPWNGIIRELVASENKNVRKMMNKTNEKEYIDLRRQKEEAVKRGDLNSLHWIGTRFNVLAATGRTEAYQDAIEVFDACLHKDPSFSPAKWGLAFVYYNLAVFDLVRRDKEVKTPSGLYIFPLDKRGADLMIQVYRLSTSAVRGGYGPSDPNVLEMSKDKLLAYCRSKGSAPDFCREVR
jgi:hypothetical protein